MASLERPRNSVVLPILIAAIAIGTLLRSYGLSKESLWFDEAYSVMVVSHPLTEGGGLSDISPAYFTPLHFWTRAFGTSEAAVRSMSVVPSVIAIALVYLLGARFYDKKTGLLAACFTAVSTFHISFAQEARYHSTLLALLLGSMISMDFALRSEKSRGSPWPWVAYLLTTAAALYTHPYTVFFVAGQNLFFVLRWRENRRRLVPWVLVQVAIVAAFAPMLAPTAAKAVSYSQPRRAKALKFPQALFSFLAGDTLIPLDETAVQNIRGTLLANWHLLAASLIGFGVIFVAALSAAKRHARGACFFAAMCLGPMVMAFVYSFWRQIFDERYFIAASPVLYVFMASGVVHSFAATGLRRKSARTAVILASAIVLGLTCISLWQYYFHPRFGKEQWRDAVRYVEMNAKQEDLIVFDPDHIGIAYDYYAARHDVETFRLMPAADDERNPAWTAALEKMSRYNRIWLIRSHFNDNSMPDRFRKIFRQESLEHFPKGKTIDVYLMRR